MNFPNELRTAVLNKSIVLLDFDNTLYPYPPCHKKGLQGSFVAYNNLMQTALNFEEFYSLYQEGRDKVHQRIKGTAASHSRLLYFQSLLEAVLGRSHSEYALQLDQVYWDAYFSVMTLCDWVEDFLAHCRNEGKSIVMVTNHTTELQIKKLCFLNLAEKIDFLVTSEEAGVEKPHKNVFNLALHKAAGSPADAVIIGDGVKEDRSDEIDFLHFVA